MSKTEQERKRESACSQKPPANSNLEYIADDIRERAFALRWSKAASEIDDILLAAVMSDEPDPSTWPPAFFRSFITPFELEREQSLPFLPLRTPKEERQKVELLIDEISVHRFNARKREASYRAKRKQKRDGARLGFPRPKEKVSLVTAAVQLDECSGNSCASKHCGCYKRTAERLGPGLRAAQVERICKQFHEDRSSGVRFVNATDDILRQLADLVSTLIEKRKSEERARADVARQARHYQPQSDADPTTVIGAFAKSKNEKGRARSDGCKR